MEQMIEKVLNSPLLSSGDFWVSISFIGLLAIALYAGLPRLLAQGLDKQRDAITKELAEAEALYAKAEALLAEHQAKLEQQEQEGRAIMERAQQQARDYQAEQEKALSEKLARLEAQAKNRIAQEKELAMATLHREAMQQALDQAQKLITSEANQQELAEQAIEKIETQLNT